MQDHDLKQKLKGLEVPPPSKGAEERAVNAAMQAFAAHQELKENRKGFTHGHRPTDTTQMWEQLIGRLSMRKAYVFAGSMAAIAVVLAITTTHYSAIMYPNPVGIIVAPPLREKPVTLQGSQQVPFGMVTNAAPPEVVEALKPEIASNAYSTVTAVPPPPIATPNAVTQNIVAAPPPPVAPKEEQLQAVLKAARPYAQAENKKMAEADKDMAAAGALAVPQYESRAKALTPSIVYRMPHVYYPVPPQMQPYAPQDKFEHFQPNPTKLVAIEPVSTFSIDVDTSSYSYVRRMLNSGVMPQPDMVRVEEMINYFPYNYAVPESREEPFKLAVAVYATPWDPNTKLVHIGIKGHDIVHAAPRANLVFLIDVSGSMMPPDRLPLVKNALRMLVDQLNPDDTVGIVVYAGNVGTVLEPTRAAEKDKIDEAISHLEAGGSTAGGEGLRQAYALAETHFDKNAVNRVILSTDGDFNVGVTDPQTLQDLVDHERQNGIYLSIMGVGHDNYNDALMHKLARHGNGSAAYVDNLNEARKVLVDEAYSTLFPIADDVKIQVEFNPRTVAAYRLIGYESRLLNREDFNNDAVDAGEVGSGHAVTAIYEITPASSKFKPVDDLRYGKPAAEPEEKADSSTFGDEYAFLKIRYKLPGEDRSRLLSTPIGTAQEIKSVAQASDDVRFSTAVAAFGQILRGDSLVAHHYGYDDVVALAEGARGTDTFGYRAEFTNLVRLTKAMQPQRPEPSLPQPVE